MLKILIILSLSFYSLPCFAKQNIPLVVKDVTNLEKCRKDFAHRLCNEQPNLYKCQKVIIPKNKKEKYVHWEELYSQEDVRYFIQKINRRNTLIWSNHCIAIPLNSTISKMEIAPFAQDTKEKDKLVVIDLYNLSWGAYNKGKLINWGIANGGMGICKETGRMECKTPIGEWFIKEKRKYSKSTLYPVECSNKKKCGHPLRWFQIFGNKSEGLHGEYHLLGSNVSHGCVRITIEDAKWLFNEFVEIGTKIIVLDY